MSLLQSGQGSEKLHRAATPLSLVRKLRTPSSWFWTWWRNSWTWTIGFWYLTANCFIRSNSSVSVLLNCCPAVILDRLVFISSEQQAYNWRISWGPMSLYSSLYWSQVTLNSAQSSADLSKLISGLGNFSGLLWFSPPAWTVGWSTFTWMSNSSFAWAYSNCWVF